jgi:hypothetical protein
MRAVVERPQIDGPVVVLNSAQTSGTGLRQKLRHIVLGWILQNDKRG